MNNKQCHTSKLDCKGAIVGKTYTIVGVNMRTGEQMRPANSRRWNDMLAGLGAKPGCKLQQNCNCLAPGVQDNGVATLIVKSDLRTCDYDTFEQVMQFAVDNDLWIKVE